MDKDSIISLFENMESIRDEIFAAENPQAKAKEVEETFRMLGVPNLRIKVDGIDLMVSFTTGK